MSRNQREGRYAGWSFGNHYRSVSTNPLPSSYMARARYIESGKDVKVRMKWIKDMLWRMGG